MAGVAHRNIANERNSSTTRGAPLPDDADIDGEFHWSDWSPRVSRLNAPREDGATLIEPPLLLAGAMATVNARTIVESDCDVQGRSLHQLAAEAREQLLADALQYTRSYRDVDSPAADAPIYLAGHQPEMFHPGVWYKNFVLARLAAEHGAVAVNLQIDSDTLKRVAVRVPGGSVEQPRVESVSLDRAAADAPYEQRGIIDRNCFESFGERALKHLRPLVADPLVQRFWPLAVARSRETDNLGACVAQARHQLEGTWGLQTLELPQSRVCDLPAMRWFIAHLLAHLPRLWETYNTALLEYRREHKVRSAAHPVPELDADDDWLEAPLWIWSLDQPRRRPLFVRQKDDRLVLSDRDRLEAVLPIAPEGDAAAAVEQLAALHAAGIRIRTRALITTLAARLLLGNLFVHGIGGAKYDQLTDRIISQFFGLVPPGYLVVSGTLRLPVVRGGSSGASSRELRQRIRELEFHPERFLSAGDGASTPIDAATERWIAEKQRWIAQEPTPVAARQHGQAIRQANFALQPTVAALRDAWSSQAQAQAQRERSESILTAREYAFVLYPEVDLTKFLLPILEKSAESV